jgi:uncharacterized membrane protein YjjP (DUF1212 family)
MDQEKLLDMCCEMGRQLLVNGAEIYRVEESLERIFSAYGADTPEVFAIPSCIIVTIRLNGQSTTRAVRIHSLSNNLHRLHRLNDLCRRICKETPDPDSVNRTIQEIVNESGYSLKTGYFAYALTAVFFTLFWGGTVIDALISLCCGLLVRYTVSSLHRVRANVFFLNVISSMLLALIPVLLTAAGVPIHTDKIIIGTIMLLVPGVAITNAMRDVLAGDFLTAIIRFTEVLIVSMGIATGIALSIGFGRLVFGM